MRHEAIYGSGALAALCGGSADLFSFLHAERAARHERAHAYMLFALLQRYARRAGARGDASAAKIDLLKSLRSMI